MYTSYQQVDDVGCAHGPDPGESWSCSHGHVSDVGGEELCRVEVGDGERLGDEELPDHGDGDGQPHRLTRAEDEGKEGHDAAADPASDEGSAVALDPTQPAEAGGKSVH